MDVLGSLRDFPQTQAWRPADLVDGSVSVLAAINVNRIPDLTGFLQSVVPFPVVIGSRLDHGASRPPSAELQPGLRTPGPAQVESFLKFVRYPHHSMPTRSALFTPGNENTWPKLLGVLDWVVCYLNYRDKAAASAKGWHASMRPPPPPGCHSTPPLKHGHHRAEAALDPIMHVQTNPQLVCADLPGAVKACARFHARVWPRAPHSAQSNIRSRIGVEPRTTTSYSAQAGPLSPMTDSSRHSAGNHSMPSGCGGACTCLFWG